MKKIRQLILLTALLFSISSKAQVTTAGINGKISDASGKALEGANLTATHTPSGTRYAVSTRKDGRYNLEGMRVGGPYSIKVTFVGYKESTTENIVLSLGQNLRLDINLIETSSEMKPIEIIGARKNEIMNSQRTGAATNVKEEVINTLPTFNRSMNDFVRLTPQSKPSSVASTAGAGLSFAGQDSRFNNLTIDGSIFNNSFGLASAPAGQTNSTPISLDAIEEIQVNVAPFDVRQGGFVGAGINAVTRSGTNEIKGSVFYNGRNQDYSGKKADGVNIVKNNFDLKQFGFRLGGPIIKNKLFYFINAEAERRNDPATTYLANRPGLDVNAPNVTRVRASAMDSLSNFLKSKYNYDPGQYEDFPLETMSNKILAKIDYNLSDKHKISVRYNYLRSSRDVPASNSGSFNNRSGNKFALNFQSSNYIINNDIHSVIGEINSRFSSKLTNQLQVGFTANRDYRDSRAGVFPLVDILEGGRNLTTFGYEPFTPNNILNTNTIQFQDNVTYYLKNHILTGGINFEQFKFENTFTPTYYGQFVYNSLNDFYRSANGDTSVTAARYALTYSALPNKALPTAITKVSQPGVYVQDVISLLKDNLKLTVGLRVDVPIFDQTALKNAEVENFTFKDENSKDVKYSTDKLPNSNPLFSPRIGFNYAVKGKKTMQLRGGTGLFSGRPPYVWISNQLSNNGILTGSLRVDNTKKYPFSPDVEAYIPANPTLPSSYNLAMTDPDFRFPQLWRNNLAMDYQLPFEIVATVEGIFSKNINQIYYINANQEAAKAKLAGPDNRDLFPGAGLTGAAQNNALRVNDKITDNIILKNTNKGYNYSVTLKLEKQYRKNWYAMMAYNYSQTKDVITGGSIAFSSWRDNFSVNGNNNVDLAYSEFDQRHRLIGAVTYRLNWLKNFGTNFSLFFQSYNQGRGTFRVNGDLNGDQLVQNDLLFVPNKASDLRFQEYTFTNSSGQARVVTVLEQQTAFDAFIDNNKYLKENRGKHVERNGYVMPWLTLFDFSIQQDLFTKIKGKDNKIQLRADFYNIANLFSNKWGVADVFQNSAPLQFRSYDAVTKEPIYRFTNVGDNLPTSATIKDASLSSVWQVQLGLRYIFN